MNDRRVPPRSVVEGLIYSVRVKDVALNKSVRPRTSGGLDVRPLYFWIVERIQAIETGDIVALGQQVFAKVGANKPGAPGNQNVQLALARGAMGMRQRINLRMPCL